MSIKISQAVYTSIAIVIACSGFFYTRHFYHDDAYISLRYVYNLLHGKGLVWNASEYVQGYTNFLFVILTSLLGLIDIDLVTATKVIGITSWLILVSSVFKNRKLFPDKISYNSHFSTFVVSTSLPLITWAQGGLESVFFSLMVTNGIMFILKITLNNRNKDSVDKNAIVSGCFFACAYLSRPDGAVFGIMSGLFLLYLVTAKELEFKNLSAYVLSILIIVIPYSCWQYHYYGDIVPNTFYAKSGTPQFISLPHGLSYIKEFCLSPPYIPIIVILMAIFAFKNNNWCKQQVFLFLLTLSFSSYLIWIGGDHMPAFRMLLPVIPVLAILAGSLKTEMLSACSVRVRHLLSCIFIVAVISQLKSTYLAPEKQDAAADVGASIGRYIHKAWSAGSLVALHTAGSTPYYALDLKFIDMLGLNDPVIAKREIREEMIYTRWQNVPGHLKGDGDYILKRRPDFIIAGPAEGSPVSDPWFLTDVELSGNPEFNSLYSLEQRNILDEADPNKTLLFTYYRRRE